MKELRCAQCGNIIARNIRDDLPHPDLCRLCETEIYAKKELYITLGSN